MRSSSWLIRSLMAITSLKVSATLPASPVQSAGTRTEKFPRLNAINASSICFISRLFSPLKRVPFVRRAIETGLDFFIRNQEREKRKRPTDREFRSGNNEPISRRLPLDESQDSSHGNNCAARPTPTIYINRAFGGVRSVLVFLKKPCRSEI